MNVIWSDGSEQTVYRKYSDFFDFHVSIQLYNTYYLSCGTHTRLFADIWCVCVCVCERERERGAGRGWVLMNVYVEKLII